jgi:phage tail sheath protein FI
MPVAPQVSYPGVYIQEVPSDVRTITPVETATTAFIGRALRGPVNKPVICNSYADFERVFGGLWLESSLGYAVNHFFLNGGSKAVIVRLAHPNFATDEERDAALDAAKQVATAAKSAADGKAAKTAAQTEADKIQADAKKSPAEKAAAQAVVDALESLADDAKADDVKKAADEAIGDAIPLQARLTVGESNKLVLEAASPGTWGNQLCAHVSYPDDKIKAQLEQKYHADPDSLFNLTVHDRGTGATEHFADLTVVPNRSRSVDRVLENSSNLVRVSGSLPSARADKTDELVEKSLEDLKKAGEAKGASDEAKKKGKNAADKLKLLEQPFNPNQDWRYVTVAEDGQGTDGSALEANDFIGNEAGKKGLYALEHVDIFNLLCIPPYTEDDTDLFQSVLPAAAAYCEKRRALLLVDPPKSWESKDKAREGFPIEGLSSNNAAIFFPRIQAPNLLRDNQVEEFAPGGVVAGVFARTDATRGVWKAPAGQEATLTGIVGLSVPLTDAENGELNPLGINCLRQMPAAGYVVWGARTIVGDDRLASQWKYIPVRRTALYIEESLYRGTHWAVFEPNDEPLWSQLRLNIGVFMHGLFRQGAFQGQSPREAYFVKCDSTTTTQADIDRGIVNIVVGFAPLKPAEFVVLYIQQMAGQLAV